MSAVLKGAGGSGSKQQRTPVEAPDSLQSIARARILDLLGEGEIEGFATANALESIYLDETPIANADGSLNFVDVQVDTRLGTQHQDHIAGFKAVENEIAVSQELRPESPFVRQITNLQLSAVNIRVSTPQLSKADTSNGDIKGHSVRYAIDLAVDGGAYVTVLNSAITGKTTTKYERSHRVDLPAATSGWIVRVRRLTAMANSASIADLTFVESLTEVIDGKFRYPNSALAGLGIDAAQFGRIPTRAYNVLGRRVAVPSNYNPITRAYAGVWDGTFKQAWTNNPAWGYYDLVINDRFGLGDRISAAQVDKWTLYKVARYCDGMVPDGRGGMEPRFTAALRLTTRDQALKVLQDVASIFRSMAYWAGGSVMSVADMPEDPVYTYHNGNVIDGRFTYSGSSGRARHTVALVSWSDPSDFGRQKIEYVPDEEGIARYGINQTEVIAFGCQSQGQAQRLGKWILLTEKLETDTVTFGAGLDATVAMPGQIIGVADSLRAGRRIGGRVRSATPSQITLDAMPMVAVGDQLTCTLPDAVTQTRIVSGIAGNTLTLSVPFTGTPVPDSAWSIRSTALYEQRFRVLEVKEEEGIRHAITALRHVEGKFDAVELGIEVQLPPITSLPAKVQLPPTGLVIEHRDVVGENTTQTVVSVRWEAIPGAVAYDVEWRQGQGSWVTAGRSYGTTMDIYGVLPGPFEFKVTAVNAVGLQSPPVHEGPYEVPENAVPPRSIDAITREQIAQQALIDQAALDAAQAQAAAAEALALAGTQWNDTTTWPTGAVVYEAGRMYRALQMSVGVQPPNPAYWQDIGTITEAQGASTQAISQLQTDVNEQGDEFAAAITQVKAGQIGSPNLLRNATFTPGLGGWQVSGNNTGLPTFVGQNTGSLPGDGNVYAPLGQSSLLINWAGTTPIGRIVEYVSDLMDAKAGDTLLASTWINSFRCDARLVINYYNAAGGYLGQDAVQRAASSVDQATFSNVPRLVNRQTISLSDVEQVRFVMQVVSNGEPDAYCWFTHPLLEKVPAGKTLPSPWNEGAGGLATATFALQVAQDAQITLTTNVNGHVSGMVSKNDGQRGVISFLADVFEIIASGSVGVNFGRTGRGGYCMRFYAASIQLVMGINFGATNNLCFWYGPNVGEANANKANGTIWFDNTGGAYFKGAIIAGSIRNGGYSSSTNGTVTYSTGSFGSTGNPIQVNASWAYDQSQVAAANASQFTAGAGQTVGTLQLWRALGTGPLALVASQTFTGTMTINNESDGPSRLTYTAGGSVTYLDSEGTSQNRTFEVRLINRSNQSFTVSGGSVTSVVTNQATGVITAEN